MTNPFFCEIGNVILNAAHVVSVERSRDGKYVTVLTTAFCSPPMDDRDELLKLTRGKHDFTGDDADRVWRIFSDTASHG